MPDVTAARRAHLVPYVVLGVVLIVFSVSTLPYVGQTQDDTYITLRYAETSCAARGWCSTA